jgi:hypothetical protein
MSEWIPGNIPSKTGDYWVTLKSGIVTYDEFYSIEDADFYSIEKADIITAEWYLSNEGDVIAYMPIEKPAPYILPKMKETKIHTWDYLSEFCEALKNQLVEDEKKWGTTWLERSKNGQEKRAFDRYHQYYAEWVAADIPIPWLKIAGEALIAWIRENNKLDKTKS